MDPTTTTAASRLASSPSEKHRRGPGIANVSTSLDGLIEDRPGPRGDVLGDTDPRAELSAFIGRGPTTEPVER